MWAFLWNAWYFGKTVKTPKELDFAWATEPKSNWQTHMIYHNAGVVQDQRDKFFYKGDYMHSTPYKIENTYDESLACHYYVREILETGMNSPLIKEFPSTVQMAKNLSEDVKNNVKQFLSGNLMASDEVHIQRMDICTSCPFFNDDQKRCLKCGCFMPAKTKLEASSCPIEKW